MEGGLETLREALAEDSENPKLLFTYGNLLYQTGQPGLAEWPLRKAMKDPVWFEAAGKLLAAVEQRGGNFENAAKIYAEILEVNPDDMEVRIQRANACARTPALFDEALAEVDRILEIDPEQLGAFKPRILALMGKNDVEGASAALEELGERIKEEQSEENPIRGWHCATMAIFASDSGDHELASQRWAECEEKFPTHENVVSQSIEFHKKRGELDRALEVAEAAFAAAPDEGSGYRLMVAEILRELGRTDETEALLIEGVEVANSDVNRTAALLALTEHYKTVGDAQAAAASLERALGIAQTSIGPQPDLLFTLADLLIQAGDFEKAMLVSRQMTVAAHRSLVQARIAHERMEYARALELYSETTRLWPENPYAPYHEARAAMSVGLFDRAFQSYLLSIRVDDAATDARTRAARLLAAEGRLGSAIEMLRTSRVAMSAEAELFSIELVSQSRGPSNGRNAANAMSERRPAYFGAAIAAAARGASRREDPSGAWAILKPMLSFDLPPVNQVPILHAAARFAPDEAELALVKPLVDRAVEAQPGSARVRETEGILRERMGSLDEAAESYRAALEIEPESVSTLLRLARVTARSDPQAGIDLLEQALAIQTTRVDPFEEDVFIEAIAVLPASSPDVVSLLESGLALAPSSGEIAYRLALALEPVADESDRVARLAGRAVRFQAGEDAIALRNRIQG